MWNARTNQLVVCLLLTCLTVTFSDNVEDIIKDIEVTLKELDANNNDKTHETPLHKNIPPKASSVSSGKKAKTTNTQSEETSQEDNEDHPQINKKSNDVSDRTPGFQSRIAEAVIEELERNNLDEIDNEERDIDIDVPAEFIKRIMDEKNSEVNEEQDDVTEEQRDISDEQNDDNDPEHDLEQIALSKRKGVNLC